LQGIEQASKFITAPNAAGTPDRGGAKPGAQIRKTACRAAHREIALHQAGALRPSCPFG